MEGYIHIGENESKEVTILRGVRREPTENRHLFEEGFGSLGLSKGTITLKDQRNKAGTMRGAQRSILRLFLSLTNLVGSSKLSATGARQVGRGNRVNHRDVCIVRLASSSDHDVRDLPLLNWESTDARRGRDIEDEGDLQVD